MPTVRSLMHVRVEQRDQKLGDNVHSLPLSRLKIDFQDILRKSRRTTASLPSKQEADYFRSRYSSDGCRAQAPVHVASASNLSENAFDLFSARIRENRLRGGPPSRKRSFTRCMPSSRSVCQQSTFSSKTRRKLPSRYQFKRFKCLSSVRSLQDEGHPSSAPYPAAQRLARQDRSEGRVFCDPNLARSQKIPALCLEANSPRICMSSVRFCSSRPCIYEDHETSSVASTPDRDLTDNLFGRHSPYGCVRDRSPARHAYSSIFIREPRFCDQPREILFSPTQQLEFLGFLVNTRDMTLLLPDCKASSIKTLCSTLLSQRDVSVRELSRLIARLYFPHLCIIAIYNS